MVRDHRKAETARKNGRGGGNPSFRNKSRNPASDNPSDKGEDKPQKPEARSQISTSPIGDDGRAVGLAKSVFDFGLQYLGANGFPEDKARRLLGRWRKDYGDDRVLAALGDAQTAGPTDPAAYVTAILNKPPQSGAEIDLDAVFAGINADGSIQ